MLARLLLVITIILGEPAVAESSQVEVIELRHTLPEDLIPALRPFLETGDRITSHGNKLIVRTSDAQLEQIKVLLEELDRPLKQLRISIRSGGDLNERNTGTQIRSTLNKGDITITNNGRPLREDSHTTIRVNRQYTTSGSASTQQVLALEGKPVYISEGQLVPLLTGGGYYLPGVEYRDIASGFIATPRVSGNTVRIAVSRHHDRLKNGEIKTGAIDTTITGQLGQWLLIGQIDNTSDERRTGTRGYSSTRSTREQQTWIRIELD
jgi:hypothetical protein